MQMHLRYQWIADAIFNDLEIDESRLREVLSTLNEVVRKCLQARRGGEAARACESALSICRRWVQERDELTDLVETCYAEGIFRAYEGIRCLYEGNLDKAINFLEKSQRSFNIEHQDQWNEGIIWLNLGRLYRVQNRGEAALFAFQRSLHVFTKVTVEKRQKKLQEVLDEIHKTCELFGQIAPQPYNAKKLQQQWANSYHLTLLSFLPIIDEIAAGKASPVSDDVIGYITTENFQVGEDILTLYPLRGTTLCFLPEYHYFAVHVTSDSMVNANIDPNDYVILRKPWLVGLRPEHEDIVAVVISESTEGNKATLKRFIIKDEGKRIILKPESPNPVHHAYEFSPEDFKGSSPKVRIVGIAIAVLKRVQPQSPDINR